MSMYRAFKSAGSVNSDGLFDFKDEFGQDPIRSRYANTAMAEDDSEARVQLAASEMELAKASLEALTEPVRKTAEFFEGLNKTAKIKNDMMKASRVNAQSIKFRDELDGAEDYTSLVGIASNPQYSEVLQDPEHKARYESRVMGFQTQTLASLQGKLNSASTQEEINSILVGVPVAFQADPEFSRTVSGLATAATSRVNLLRASQASSALSSAANTDAMLKAQQQYADVMQDPTVAAAAERNQKQLQVEQNLRMSGIDPARFAIRTGANGDELGYDYEAAEAVLKAQYDPQDIRTIQGAINNKMKQLGEITDPQDPRAAQIQGEIDDLNNSLTSALLQQKRGAAVAKEVLRDKGATTPDWLDIMLDGETSPAPAAAAAGQPAAVPAAAAVEQPAPAPATAPAPAPKTGAISLEEEIAQAAETARQESTVRSVQPKLVQKRAEREARIAKAERRLKIQNLKAEKERLTQAIAKAGLAEDAPVIQRANARIAEIDQELDN